MPGSICIVCEKNLILDEEEICAHCELSNQNAVAENPSENGKYIETHNVNCGCCDVIVKEDSEGLYCDVCDRWFHNACCENPLIEELYSQLNAAPSNVKWFCDKCIWITEKWISSFPTLMKERGRARRLKTAVNSFRTLLENDPEYDYTKEPEVNIKIENEDIPFGFDETHSTDSEEYSVREKVKKKKKIQKPKIIDPNAKSIPCSFCDKTFTQQLLVNRHKRRVHKGKEPFKCSHCDAVFFSENKLKIHDRTHTGIKKPFQCSLCDKSFSREGWLEKHQIVHTSEKPNVCRGCKECFDSQDLLKEHRKTCTHIVNREKPCICSHCGQIFARRRKLIIHERIHTGEKPYKCNQCDKCFGNPDTHKKHQRTHTENKTHICSSCGKCFARHDHLKKHERIHTGEKPHQCSTCGKSFHRMDHLKKHEKYHIGEKPHMCTYCGKDFVRRDNLRAHERIHTGEKPSKRSASPRSKPISPKSRTSSQSLKTETSCDNSSHSDNYSNNTLPIFTQLNPALSVSTNSMSGPSRTNISSHNPTIPTSTTYNLPMSSSHPNRPIFNDPSHQMPQPIRLMFNQQLACLEGWGNDGRWANSGMWGNYGQTKD